MAIKPNRNNKKVFLATAAAILLLLLLALALFSNQDSLFNGKVSVQASTNKQSYVQGENVTILADLVNGKNEPVAYPDSMGFSVEASNGTGVYNMTMALSWEPQLQLLPLTLKCCFIITLTMPLLFGIRREASAPSFLARTTTPSRWPSETGPAIRL